MRQVEVEGPGEGLCLTGWPPQVSSRLHRKVGALSRHGGFHKKIGITNAPRTRWLRHYADGWRRMELIYRSDSHNHVCALERQLVERFHLGVALGGYCHNQVGGGGGRKPATGPFYLYMLLGRRHARFAYAVR